MSKVLFVHHGFPGRFTFLAKALMARGWSCALISERGGNPIPGASLLQWTLTRGTTPGIYEPATRAEIDFLRGRASMAAASTLKERGFEPSLIIGHPGWGEMLFLGEVFLDAPQIPLAEFYYRTRGADLDFDPEFGPPSADEQARVHAKNAAMAMTYADAARIVAPTPFQAQLLPEAFQSRTRIIHEGVDTAAARPLIRSSLRIDPGLSLGRDVPVITFINRVFEPMRGFHSFMRALPMVLDALPTAHVLIVGSDEAKGYGPKAAAGTTWKSTLLAELGERLDTSRVHFTGPIDYDRLIEILSFSTAHVYLTYPFVLSWSLLDAMACECLVIGSDTAPVRDVIEHGVNGLLVDFFDYPALAEAMIEACLNPNRYAALRRAARATVVANYDRATTSETAWLALIDEVMAQNA